MKKLVAFLLTLTLLISMVGTVSLAADETKGTTFPKETVSVDAKGNVSVTLPGVENFATGYADVLPKDAKAGDPAIRVPLTFDKKTVAYVGKNASVADGTVTYFSLSYGKEEDWAEEKIDAKNKVYVYNYATYSYHGFGDLKGKISSAAVYMGKQYATINSKGEEVPTTFSDDLQYIETDYTTGLITSDVQVGYYQTVGAKGKVNAETITTTTKEYDSKQGKTPADQRPLSGRYLKKTVEETKWTYDLDGVQMTETNTKKVYNEDNKLLVDNKDTKTTTYSADKAYQTDKTVSEGKELSTKGLTKETTKGTKTETFIYVKKVNDYVKQTVAGETKKFNRDGKLMSATTTAKTYKDNDTLNAETSTEKTYNTYTGAVTDDKLIEKLRINNKLVEQYTTTKNNDDGSMRYKTVETVADTDKKDSKGAIIKERTEIHYNKDNKVVAKKDKEGTWTDGNGKIIGWNVNGAWINDDTVSVTDPKKDYYVTKVDFKQRTGEVAGYKVENTVTKDGVTTKKTVAFKNGAQIQDDLKVTTNKTGTYALYKNGVLNELYTNDTKDGVQVKETKYYDVKGTLNYSTKKESKGDNYKKTTFDHRGKMTRIEEVKNENDYLNKVTTVMKVDPETQIMTETAVELHKVNKDKDVIETITQYFNNVNELIYSKTSTKADNNIWATIYTDAAGKEFARTYNYVNSTRTLEDHQNIISENQPSVKGLDATLERRVEKVEFKDKDTTTTKDFTKWTVTGGVKGAELTRKEVVKQIVRDDYNQTTVTKDGILTKDTYVAKNDYDEPASKTVTYYDWYTGKQSAKNKYFYTAEDDPWTYSKQYDKYNNLQTYSAEDNTDEWHWKHTYYENGALKEDKWKDGLDGDSSYDADYYRSGALAARETWNNGTGNEVKYNKDGKYTYWADTAAGVKNAWLYDSTGTLTGYKWNQKTFGNGYSYDQYDAAGNLIYSEKSESDLAGGAIGEDGKPKGSTVKTRTDPAGNVWTVTDGTNVTLTLKNGGSGWQSAVGQWFYIENGKPVQSAWKKIDGSWYYFGADGAMETGIVTEDKKNLAAGDKVLDKAYALDAKTGALVVGGWVSYSKNGNDTGWAFTDANGEVVTGWKQIGGKWYYFEEGWHDGHENEYKAEAKWTQSGTRGQMVTGAAKVWNADGTQHTYFFNKDGSWDNSPGWKCAESIEVGRYGDDDSATTDSSRPYVIKGLEWHYYDKNGNEVKGWAQIDGEWYYFNEDGVMKNGWVKSGNNWYFMDRADGSLATNGWVEDVYEGWYYMDKNGQYQTGWLKDGDNWYYLKQDGAMAENEWAKYGNNWYYMGSDGQIKTGWVQDKGSWYYLKQDGAMKTGWEGSGNTWYYLGDDGAMLTNTDKTIDGKVYHFDENGLCTNP